ncbi:ABC transporter permease [uncultured Clostridium sp.]|uniref:ABC transporter permease n=1 Tax=uncultured Clostridium sp. TaxID=59620 RepID=UPI0025ED18D5|nr:ABC transporter permease [uncultured Clostridium sp.]
MNETTVTYKKKSQGPEIWRRFKKNRRALLGLGILIFLVFLAVFANVVSPYDPTVQDIPNKLQGPSIAHLMGTDQYGRDILSRVIFGTRISLMVGIVSTSMAVAVGGTLGSVAGYYGGVTESIIMRVTDIFLAIPSILLNIAIAAALGGGLVNMMIALGISYIPAYCRIMRSSIYSVRDQEFIEASRAAGAGDGYIILHHIVPNCLSPMIVQATLKVGAAILLCSTLSFIGVGISPPTPEWGSMIATGREYLRTAPHLTTFPGIAIMLAVFSLNLMGDGLRDALDPKLKN